MKKHLFYWLSLSLIFTFSCKDDNPIPEFNPREERVVDGEVYPIIKDVSTDVNGDGSVDEDDNTAILGGSMNVDYVKDENGKETELWGTFQPGSEPIVGVKVEDGAKLCYSNVERNCDDFGGLYSFETSANTDSEALIEGSAKIADLDNDSIVDWVATVRLDLIETLTSTYSNNSLSVVETAMNEIGNTNIIINNNPVYITDNNNNLIQAKFSDIIDTSKLSVKNLLSGDNSLSNEVVNAIIAEAINEAIIDAVKLTDKTVDIQALEQEIQNNIIQAILEEVFTSEATEEILVVKSESIKLSPESIKLADIKTAVLDNIAVVSGTIISEKATDQVSEAVANEIISTVSKAKEASTIEEGKPAKGICPKGYHIPTDGEWMVFEKALGMEGKDLARYGEDVTDRGAGKGIIEALQKTFHFEFGGYASINGTYAQLGEVGVFWTSTVGIDSKGKEYTWVREISKKYDGIVRYKHYEKSGLSVRCFAD
ncbi:MAG: fibrobacter succinogenes major paralogous domain-containing protein [Bacteroidales bacterium]|nr:fibrobacter succinogenes major paralogous domain-containing protein [Bacteroidales bacterium]